MASPGELTHQDPARPRRRRLRRRVQPGRRTARLGRQGRHSPHLGAEAVSFASSPWSFRAPDKRSAPWHFIPTARSLRRAVRIGWSGSGTSPDGRPRREFHAAASRVNALAFSPDGTKIATGSLERTVNLWDAATGQSVAVFAGHAAQVFHVAFSSDGTELVWASQDATVKLWDLRSEPGVRQFQRFGQTESEVRWVGGVAFRLGATEIAAAGTNHTIAIWDAASGRIKRDVRDGSGTMIAIAYNHHGTQLAAAGTDRRVRIWDLKARTEPRVLSDDNEGLASLAFSPDDHVLATGGSPEVIQALKASFQRPSAPRGQSGSGIRSAATSLASSTATRVRFIALRLAPMAPVSRQPAAMGSSGSGTRRRVHYVRPERPRKCCLRRHVQPGWNATGFRRGRRNRSLLGYANGPCDWRARGSYQLGNGSGFQPRWNPIGFRRGRSDSPRLGPGQRPRGVDPARAARPCARSCIQPRPRFFLAGASADGIVRVWESDPSSEPR